VEEARHAPNERFRGERNICGPYPLGHAPCKRARDAEPSTQFIAIGTRPDTRRRRIPDTRRQDAKVLNRGKGRRMRVARDFRLYARKDVGDIVQDKVCTMTRNDTLRRTTLFAPKQKSPEFIECRDVIKRACLSPRKRRVHTSMIANEGVRGRAYGALVMRLAPTFLFENHWPAER